MKGDKTNSKTDNETSGNPKLDWLVGHGFEQCEDKKFRRGTLDGIEAKFVERHDRIEIFIEGIFLTMFDELNDLEEWLKLTDK